MSAMSPAMSDDIIQTGPQGWPLIEHGTVQKINEDATLILDNGHSYILSNLRFPQKSPAMDWLKNNLLNKKISIHAPKNANTESKDRFGRTSAHALTEKKEWIQAEMIRQGLAIVSSTPAQRDLVSALYILEHGARRAQKGLWGNPAYAVKNDRSIRGTKDSFQIFEGTIKSVAVKDLYCYINFGADYKTDFTAVIKRDSFSLFRSAADSSFLPEIWKGGRVRIRGWVEEKNGPMMLLTHPEQIEFPES